MKHVVGIDLGTTHCVMASSTSAPNVQLFSIPQLVAPGELATRTLLPSFLYLPTPGELTASDTALPWGAQSEVVGEAARKLGAKTPTRLVASAKSWICHGGINRRAPVLPWSAPDGEPHVSPFEAQVRYLAHLRAAWEQAHPQAKLAAQDVVITVPASFDEGARELTTQAAAAAGMGDVQLLEEPQAAFYDFIAAHPDALGQAKLVLVVDVGGGTTDLTLLRVHPKLERIAVGGHLLLGGDNMDAALAHHVLKTGNVDRQLDPSEWSALMQSAREAKELLLSADAPAETTVSVQKRGSRLFSGTVSVKLARDDVRALLLDGFVPQTGPADVPAQAARAGLTTLGLPYATETAIPRHVCAFLRKHAVSATEAGAQVVNGLPRPDLVLLNGGVFNGAAVASRLIDVMSDWFGGERIKVLPHTSLDTAVAAGAARYGLAKRGEGRVIAGGSPRAYFIGIDTPEGRRGLCVVPRGLDEGQSVKLDTPMTLQLGQRVAFPLYAYTGDRYDAPGTLVSIDDLDTLPPLETALKGQGSERVMITTTLSEKGALEVFLVTVSLPPQRWRLDFALAPPAPPAARDADVPAHPRLAEAKRLVDRAFSQADAAKAKALRTELETALGDRGTWNASTCRALADAFLAHAPKRATTTEHELAWMRHVGWCMRPGFGMPEDAERMARLWQLHAQEPKASLGEWWILWRRVAAGLDRAQQTTLLTALTKHGPRASVEMLQLLGALEQLPRARKQEAGEWFWRMAEKANSYWALGRIGARTPLYGGESVEADVAMSWISRLLALDWKKADGAAFAATMLARATGDPRRDVESSMRAQVATRLKESNSRPQWVTLVTQVTALTDADASRLLGDALPTGLRAG